MPLGTVSKFSVPSTGAITTTIESDDTYIYLATGTGVNRYYSTNLAPAPTTGYTSSNFVYLAGGLRPLTICNGNLYVFTATGSGAYKVDLTTASNVQITSSPAIPTSPKWVAVSVLSNVYITRVSSSVPYLTKYDSVASSITELLTTSIGVAFNTMNAITKYKNNLIISCGNTATISAPNKIIYYNLTNNTYANILTTYQTVDLSFQTTFGLAVNGKYLYLAKQAANTIARVDLTNLDSRISSNNELSSTDICGNWYVGTVSTLQSPTGMTVNNDYLYIINNATASLTKIYIGPATPSSISVSSTNPSTITTSITDTVNSSVDGATYYYYLSSGGSTPASSASYTYLATLGGTAPTISSIPNVSPGTYSVYVITKDSTSVGNSAPIISSSVVVYGLPLMPTPDPGNTTVNAGGSVTISLFDSVNSSTNNVYYWYSIADETNYANSTVKYTGLALSPYIYTFTIPSTSISSGSNLIYVRAQNPTGYSSAFSTTVVSYVAPSAPTITSVVSTVPMRMTVSITDTTNSAGNQVYYWYSTNNSTYGNTTITKTSATTYTFDISNTGTPSTLLTDVSYTLYIRATNPVGNSTYDSSQVIVYQKPRQPTAFAWNSAIKESGNLTVNITETSPLEYYNLNNVYYYYYLYDGTGSDQSYNIVAYSNSAVKLATNGATTATFPITGKPAQTYTLYVIGVNTVGNSLPSATGVLANVYTTPFTPSITSVVSTVPMRMTVNLTDTTNSPLNQVYYWYSTDNITYGNTTITKTSATTYTFDVSNTGNPATLLTDISYTLYVRGNNTVGGSLPDSRSVVVYQTPRTPTAFAWNSTIKEPGNLTVNITETTPPTYYNLNDVYYYYYLYDGTGSDQSRNIIAYSNSAAKLATNGATTTSFPITGKTAQTYKLYVIGINSVGNSLPSATGVSANVYATPLAPTSLSVSNNASGNLQVDITDSNNSTTNGITYYYYVYELGAPSNTSDQYNTYTTARAFSSSPTTFYATLVANTYTVYVLARNAVGNSSPTTSTTIPVYTTPLQPTINASTGSSSAGTLTISVNDSVNLAVNQVYYWYSIDGTTYANSQVVKTADQTYTFTYPTLLNDVSYTLYVRGNNPIGYSSSDSRKVIVYQVPRPPTVFAWDSTVKEPGNLTVNITETTPPAYYNLNNVYYYYYLYDGVGSDQSGNILAYSNSAVKLATNIATTATFPITGKTAQTYTLYVIGVNSVGDSLPSATGVSANVYTTPLAPNSLSVSNVASGNLQVSITDSNNSATNAITYYYYARKAGTVDNSKNWVSYVNNPVPYNSSTTQFFINGLTNDTYTIYVIASNPVGNSLSAPIRSSDVMVYTLPTTPTLDTANTLSSAGGQITVALFDSVNSATNNVYYWYSIGDETNYANSTVQYTGVSAQYSIPVSGLTNGTSYTIYTRAQNTMGNSTSISTASITVYDVPSAPVLTDATAGNQTVDIAFITPNSQGNAITSYNYSVNGTTYTPFGLPLNNQYQITGLSNGSTYSISIRAKNARGNSSASNVISATPFGVPAKVSVYVVPQNESIDVSFTTPNNGGSSIVRYEYSVSSTNTDVFKPTTPLLPDNNRFTITQLTNGTPYYIRMRSVNLAGNSSPSDTVITIPYTYPDKPIILNITPLDGGIRIKIAPPVNDGGNAITGYKYATVLGAI